MHVDAGAAPSEPFCGSCLTRAPPFARAVAPFRYAYPLDYLIRRFKYHGALAHGRVLGTLLAQRLPQDGSAWPALIVPMPLHRARHRERGFNQAAELARPVGAMLGIRVDPGLCMRQRATEDQTLLSASERRRNVRGAFALTRTPDVEHVAIVDDVLTTLSTAAELARTLRRAGVATVEVWAIARALPGDAVSAARTR